MDQLTERPISAPDASHSRGSLLLPFALLIVWIAAVNVYAGFWGSLKAEVSASSLLGVSIGLVLSFIAIYTYWVANIVFQLGFRDRRSSFTIAFLPVIYLLSLSVIVEMSDINTFENPPLVTYCYLTLIVFLHVPSLALGLDRAQANRAIPREIPPTTLPLNPIIVASILTFVCSCLIQALRSADWTIVGLNGAFLLAATLLAVVASRRVRSGPR